MSNRILTKAEFNARCKEFADKFNADLTPKKVWISDMGGWFATESSCDIPYIRADIVDQLVEALTAVIECNRELVLRLSLEQDVLVGDSRMANARDALKAMEEA